MSPTDFICPFCKENMSIVFSAEVHKTKIVTHYCRINKFYFKHFVSSNYCFFEIQNIIKCGYINVTLSLDEEDFKIFYYNNVTNIIQEFNLNINIDIDVRNSLNEEMILFLIKILDKHIKLMSIA